MGDGKISGVEQTDMLTDSGWIEANEGVAFHPHGMAVTPQWVIDADTENTLTKKLFVINHGWTEGGERIEVFDILFDEEDPDLPTGLEWKYAMGALKEDEELKDNEFQKQYYGMFNGINVVGDNSVMLGKWLS